MKRRTFVLAALLAVLVAPVRADMQADRAAFIQKLIKLNVFKKVERHGTNDPRLWVTPAFMALDHEGKSKFVNVVWAYYGGGPDVVLVDSQTGKEIGRYSDGYGLRIEKD